MQKSWIDRARANPAAAAALAVFVIALATLCGAWFFQYVIGLPPCPLCLEERIPYHVVIPLSLLMAIAALVRAPAKLLTVGFIAIIIAVLCNVVLGTYHAGVEWHWWAGPTDCTGLLTDLNAGGSLLMALARHFARRLQRFDLAPARHDRGLRLVGAQAGGLITILMAIIGPLARCAAFD
jgi:disulfide bond formation protein DsbB